MPVPCRVLQLQTVAGGDVGVLIKFCALDWELENGQGFVMRESIFKKKCFIRSQNVWFFFHSEMCYDNNDLFMILNLFFFLKKVSVWYFHV